jgi:hypothetical protein
MVSAELHLTELLEVTAAFYKEVPGAAEVHERPIHRILQ